MLNKFHGENNAQVPKQTAIYRISDFAVEEVINILHCRKEFYTINYLKILMIVILFKQINRK